MKKHILSSTQLRHIKDIGLLEQVLDNAQVAIIITDNECRVPQIT